MLLLRYGVEWMQPQTQRPDSLNSRLTVFELFFEFFSATGLPIQSHHTVE